MKKFIVIICLFPFCNTIKKKPSIQKGQISELCGKNYKIWDAKIGNNLVFYRKGYLIEFNYENGRRIITNHGDFLIDTIGYFIKGDTLITDLKQSCVLLKITEDTLILKDLTKVWGVDTLFYLKSKNQSQTPTSN